MIAIRYSTRLVLLAFGIAIKIPLSRRGYLQCKNEKDMWRRYGHLGKLGRLYWECGGIVCMKRYRPAAAAEADPEGFDKAVAGIKRMIPELDIERCDLYRAENWGMSADGYVLIDYGISEHVSRMY
jgi:hypothetical protein